MKKIRTSGDYRLSVQTADKIKSMYDYLIEKRFNPKYTCVLHCSSGFIVICKKDEKVTDEIKAYIEQERFQLKYS